MDYSHLIANAIHDAFMSETLANRNAEPANVVDVADKIANALVGLRDAVCEPAAPFNTPDGGRVGNVTEAMIFIGQEIGNVASSIRDLAEAIRDHK